MYTDYLLLQVAAMRNDLSHMDLGKNMQIDDYQVKEYFKNLRDLVDCLARLHPKHFTAPQDIHDKLLEVGTNKVSRTKRKNRD